jgi:hypothetical protein
LFWFELMNSKTVPIVFMLGQLKTPASSRSRGSGFFLKLIAITCSDFFRGTGLGNLFLTK